MGLSLVPLFFRAVEDGEQSIFHHNGAYQKRDVRVRPKGKQGKKCEMVEKFGRNSLTKSSQVGFTVAMIGRS